METSPISSPHKSERYVPAIDGMRAIAILLVLSSHLGAERFVPGGFGVTLFFFISGYLITGLMIREQDETNTISISSFYIRRFLRLGPALMAMILTVSLFFLIINPIPPAQIFAAIFYYTNYYKIIFEPPTTPLDPMWSLAVEEHYYLLFPLAFSAFWGHRRRFLLALIAVTAVVLIWRFTLVLGWHASMNRTYLATDTRIDSILYGAILAVLIKCYPAKVAAYSKLFWSAGIAALLASLIYRNAIFRETLRYSLQGLALIPLFYSVLFARLFLLVRVILESRPMIWIGKVSYSLYLWHFAVLLFADYEIPARGPYWLALNIALDFILVSCSYYLIEQHFQKIRQRFR